MFMDNDIEIQEQQIQEIDELGCFIVESKIEEITNGEKQFIHFEQQEEKSDIIHGTKNIQMQPSLLGQPQVFHEFLDLVDIYMELNWSNKFFVFHFVNLEFYYKYGLPNCRLMLYFSSFAISA